MIVGDDPASISICPAYDRFGNALKNAISPDSGREILLPQLSTIYLTPITFDLREHAEKGDIVTIQPEWIPKKKLISFEVLCPDGHAGKKHFKMSHSRTNLQLDEVNRDEVSEHEDPADEAPADEAHADEAPADEAPADEASASEAPAGEALADKVPTVGGPRERRRKLPDALPGTAGKRRRERPRGRPSKRPRKSSPQQLEDGEPSVDGDLPRVRGMEFLSLAERLAVK